jgi:hypothetical protein
VLSEYVTILPAVKAKAGEHSAMLRREGRRRRIIDVLRDIVEQ